MRILRLLTFRLRTLLIAITAICMVLGWQVHIARKQQTAIDQIIRQGGRVTFDHSPASGPWGTAVPHNPPIQGPLLQYVGGKAMFQNAMEVSVDFVDPNEVQAVESLPYLTELFLSGNGVNDQSIKHLLSCGSLRALQLRGTAITNEGLRTVSQCRRIVWLNIIEAQINDDGIQHLEKMPQITSLCLTGRGITDTSLKVIRKLTNLDGVQLWNTNITEAALSDLLTLDKATEIRVESEQISNPEAAVVLWNCKQLEYLEINGYEVRPPIGHAKSNHALVAGKALILIDGVRDLRFDDTAHKTKEKASFRVSVSIANGTSSEIDVSYSDFKHTLWAVGDQSHVIDCQSPRHLVTITDANGKTREAFMDEEIVIGRTHSVEPRTVIGIDYPIVCYQPGIERGKEYVLAIEGLGQTQTTTLKFPH